MCATTSLLGISCHANYSYRSQGLHLGKALDDFFPQVAYTAPAGTMYKSFAAWKKSPSQCLVGFLIAYDQSWWCLQEQDIAVKTLHTNKSKVNLLCFSGCVVSRKHLTNNSKGGILTWHRLFIWRHMAFGRRCINLFSRVTKIKLFYLSMHIYTYTFNKIACFYMVFGTSLVLNMPHPPSALSFHSSTHLNLHPHYSSFLFMSSVSVQTS